MSLFACRPLRVLGVATIAIAFFGCAPEAVVPAYVGAGQSHVAVSAPAANVGSQAPIPQDNPGAAASVEPMDSGSPAPSVSTPEPVAVLQKGDRGQLVRDLQARLKQLKWYPHRVDGSYGPNTVDAVGKFQEQRSLPLTGFVDQETLDQLHGLTRTPTPDELSGVTEDSEATMTLDARCLTGRVLCASKAQRKLAWVVDGEIKVVLDARFGRPSLPTSNGVFSVTWKSRNHWSKKYDAAMPYALFFNGGQAVHYSPEFAASGFVGGSHGCINIRNKSAIAALFDEVREGDRVVVYKD